MKSEVLVIGAGVGGLVAAIDLAVKGFSVRVLEALDAPGGKAGATTLEGVRVDLGPSVLTLPEVFASVFEGAGERFSDHVTLTQPTPAFRYLFHDGAQVELFHRPAETIASVERSLGAHAADELARFLAYSAEIWEAAAPRFVYGAAPTMANLLRLPFAAAGAMTKIDAMRTMASAIESRVRDEHLRRILFRYATYNGSSPFLAPATLNCIAHVELALGGFGVVGGIEQLVLALVQLAERRGVRFEYGQRVASVELSRGAVAGVRLEGGRRLAASAVVSNADARHLYVDLLGPRGRLHHAERAASMSGYTMILRASKTDRAAHLVLFPEHYETEFEDISAREQIPRDPAIYVCAQSRCHQRADFGDAEPLFLMANAPPEPLTGSRDPGEWRAFEDRILSRLGRAELVAPTDRVLWRRSPADLAAQFPGSRGAIYGEASNSMFAAFRRPNNQSPVRGLYLASGSAHPGGGLPLVALSGRAAARALVADRGPG